MIAQFEVIADGSKWEVDIQKLTWKQVTDTPDTAPSGELSWQNSLVYSMAPRRPDTEGPGAGLCSFLLTPLPVEQVLEIVLRANVPTKNLTMPFPIKEIRYVILPFTN